ncbi:VCBS repeat-containing protein [Streptomyces sp. HPF1205]|uniref:FG-GAP repeat domain-containing protein n=1 Tax=Streptomyces sp. HPF1205 TaxID=2873262 RepID=UPI001CED65FB|nr:VCBS repeat-containing protein [Streptomyces sp. HPF1205]
MFSSSARSRARRGGRLLAVCTTGVLAAGALVFGPVGTALAQTGTNAGATGADVATIGANVATIGANVGATGAGSGAAPRGTAHPTFTPPTHTRPFSSAAAGTATTTPRYDYDGDGHGDIITQEDSNAIGVLSSAQKKWISLGVSETQYRDVLTPGNLTDAHSGDEVLGLTESGRMEMFDSAASLENGTPEWTGPGWQIYNQVTAVGDTNGDGWGDLLARTPSGDLYLYRGTGSNMAPFAARVKVGRGFGGYDQLIGAGDITATGVQTLVARDLNGDLWMYAFSGTGADPLSARVKIGYGFGVFNQLVGFGDDVDSVGGILARTAAGNLYYYEGTGKGGLTGRRPVGGGWNDRVIAGQGHTSVWGKNDLFGQTSGGNLYYYYSYNTGVLSKRYQYGQAGGWKGAKLFSPTSLTDHDEEPLLEVYYGWLYRDDAGNVAISGGWGGYNKLLGPGDLNADGHSDVLARDGSGVLWLISGRGDVSFYNRVKVGPGWGGYNQITGAGDINGDGYADIVARAGNGHLYLYLGTGNGYSPFRSRIDVGGGWNAYTKLAAPGDLDGDGRADIVAVTSGGRLYRYSATGHTGSSTFKGRVEIGTAGWNAYGSLF